MRDTVYSAAATGIFDSRSSSRSASFLTVSGMPAASIFSRELLDFLGLIVALAELLLDRLHLLAQEVLALVLADLGLHLRLDLRAELEHFELLDQDPVQAVHPRADVERLEHLLLDGGADRRQREAMKSASRPGSVMFIASVCRSSDSSGDSDTTCWKFVLMLRASASISRRSASLVSSSARADARAQVRLRRDDLVERQPREPLDDQPEAAVGQLEHLVDVRGGADRVEIVLRRLLDRRRRAA